MNEWMDHFIPAILYGDVKLANDVLSNERARRAAVENRRITHTCMYQTTSSPVFGFFFNKLAPVFRLETRHHYTLTFPG